MRSLRSMGQLATGDDEDAHSLRLCKFLVAGKEVVEVPGDIIVKVVAGANHSCSKIRSLATEPVGSGRWVKQPARTTVSAFTRAPRRVSSP